MRKGLTAASIGLALLAFGCNKPTESECSKAIANIQTLTGTIESDFGVKPEAALRSCRGNATKASVQCAIAAKTMADLQTCEGGIAEQMFQEEQAPTEP